MKETDKENEQPIEEENTVVSNLESPVISPPVQETTSSDPSIPTIDVEKQEPQQPVTNPNNSNQTSTPTQKVITTF